MIGKKKKQFLIVKVATPSEVLWEGEADSVSSENSQGLFDILPLHANLITLIREKPIIVRTGEKDKSYTFKSAVIYMHEDSVKIYGDI